MILRVYQIDAWADPASGWTYNDSIHIFDISMNGQPTVRKILKALRNKEVLCPESIYKIDDYFSYEGIWSVQLRSNDMPLFDLIEEAQDV